MDHDARETTTAVLPRPRRSEVDHLALVLGSRHVSPEEHAFFARAYLESLAAPRR